MGNKKSRAAQLVLNPDALEYKPSTTLIHAPVVTHATTQPSAPALAFLRSFSEPVQTLSYADLNARSTRLARTLRRLHGASISGRTSTPQTIVSLALPSSIELYIAYLAVLKAGFAFSPLPLPDDTPAERLRELVNELCSQVVIGLGSRQTWAEGLEELQWLNISDGINSGDGDDEWPAPTKDDLAYGKL
jgi:ferricrocin synthase